MRSQGEISPAPVETRRAPGPYSAATATAQDAAELGARPGTHIFERTYRTVSRARRLATITERVPATRVERGH